MIRSMLVLLMTACLTGCSNAGFYLQALSGHFDMLSRRQPVQAVLDDATTDAELRRRLVLAQAARDFASSDLLLPDNPSYRSYADLQRDYVTWNVVAAAEFSVQARVWCYVHTVCLPYRGYFDEDEARAYAAGLAADGFDVHVYGVAAYSTSGWFDDPLLNTMVRLGEERLVALLFHELAHQQLFVKQDGAFSEAFATFVEHEGMRRWLTSRADTDGLRRFEAAQMRRRDFIALLQQTRGELETLYGSELDDDRRRAGKAAVFAEMRSRYQRLRSDWDGYSGYDRWFERPLNNARLVSVATYNDWVPAFATLLRDQQGDLEAFYQAARELADLAPTARREALSLLAARWSDS